MTELKITVALQKLGSTEKKQIENLAKFLRSMADEMEESAILPSPGRSLYHLKIDGVLTRIGELHVE